MSKVADMALRDRLRAVALDQRYWRNPAPTILKDKPALYDFAADVIGRDNPVLYLEFGVAYGESLIPITERFTHPASRFIGFDSFLGLPEPWLHLPQGAFSTRGVPPPVRDKRVEFVTGYFQNSLPPFLNTFPGAGDRRVLIHFDADLYGSTLFLLSSLWPHVPDYHFMMDDFVQDDAIALFDFATAYPVEIRFHAQTRGGGARPNPNQVFAHMRRVPFTLPPQAGAQAP